MENAVKILMPKLAQPVLMPWIVFMMSTERSVDAKPGTLILNTKPNNAQNAMLLVPLVPMKPLIASNAILLGNNNNKNWNFIFFLFFLVKHAWSQKKERAASPVIHPNTEF